MGLKVLPRRPRERTHPRDKLFQPWRRSDGVPGDSLCEASGMTTV